MFYKVFVILEFTEPPADLPKPIEGRSGTIYGYATYDETRGKVGLRMTLEEWRAAAEDIAMKRNRYYYPVFDVEVVEDPELKEVAEKAIASHLAGKAEEARLAEEEAQRLESEAADLKTKSAAPVEVAPTQPDQESEEVAEDSTDPVTPAAEAPAPVQKPPKETKAKGAGKTTKKAAKSK